MKVKTRNLENIVIYITCTLLMISLMILGNITTFQFKITFFLKQFIWIVVSAPFFWFFYKKIDLEKIRPLAFPLVMFGFLLLVAVLIPGIGVERNFSRRSISLKFVNFQPSTFARPILIFYLVHYLVKNKDKVKLSYPGNFIQNYLPVLILTFSYILLIFLEPDLSTAAILFMIFLSVMFLANIKISTIVVLGLIVMILIGLVIGYGDKYRRDRYVAFMKFMSGQKLEKEIEDKFYQSKQALIALSQGKFFGKGTYDDRAKLFYLPFSKTDYIFSVIAEEFGFIGSIILILLYLVLIFSCFALASRTSSFFYSILIIAMTLNIVYNLIVNLSAVLCLIPSTGVSLPFISYGGSALLVDIITIAIILNASQKSGALNQGGRYRYA